MIKYIIRREAVPDQPNSAPSFYLARGDRDVALFVNNEYDEVDSAFVLRAVRDHVAMLDAIKDLVFLIGQLPAAKTIVDQELNQAYRRAADFLREDFERCSASIKPVEHQ